MALAGVEIAAKPARAIMTMKRFMSKPSVQEIEHGVLLKTFFCRKGSLKSFDQQYQRLMSTREIMDRTLESPAALSN
ncbi:MAG: hypothetical protein P8164_02470 [Gammaproteobacteria bacterium]